MSKLHSGESSDNFALSIRNIIEIVCTYNANSCSNRCSKKKNVSILLVCVITKTTISNIAHPTPSSEISLPVEVTYKTFVKN